MTLAGYKQLKPGEILYFSKTDSLILSSDSEFIGKDAWILKNSYDTYWGYDGFGYIIMNISDIKSLIRIEGRVSVNNHYFSPNWRDEDGDGYYVWGLNDYPPSSLPEYIPFLQDSDDTDYAKGPIDDYGNSTHLYPDLQDTIYIDDATFESFRYFHNHISVCNNYCWIISSNTIFYQGVSISVNSGCELIVDGCTLNNVHIIVKPGGKLSVINGGRIEYATGKSFSVPLGAILNIQNGTIYQNND